MNIVAVIGFALASLTGVASILLYAESNELKAEFNRILQDNKMLKQELDNTLQNLKDKESELEKSREELDSAMNKIKSMDEELNSTKQKLGITEEELEKSKRDLNDAKDELKSTRAKLLEAQDELNRSKEEHQRTLRTLEELKADYDALKERLKSVEDDLKEYTYREDKGDFNVRYDAGSRYRDVIDQIVGSLNSRLKLPYDIPMLVSSCGDVWYAAYAEYEVYTRKVNKIVLCVETLDVISNMVDSMYSNGIASNKDEAFNVFIKYIVYHEIGHAVIRIADLHIGSREESLVDDFAFYMLVKDKGDVDLLIKLYKELAVSEGKGEIEARHPSSLYLTYRQQYHDLSCLAYGAGIESNYIDLGERDRDTCKVIWYEVSHGWDRALTLWWK
ncbi:Chromosome partition protein Smc [archaeon HR04]|nr:Chromosome partition protein Smc [archaeon HR04]